MRKKLFEQTLGVPSTIAESCRRISGYQADKDTENGSLLLHAALLMRVRG